MKKSEQNGTEQNSTKRSAQVKRGPWTTPSMQRRGSVSELVQIVKSSGHDDNGGTRHNHD